METFGFTFGPSGGPRRENVPFVIGVLAALSGDPKEPLPSVAERSFLEIDVDNFDARLAAAKPRVAFGVPNAVTGEGSIDVDVAFRSIEDFAPGAVTAQVGLLTKLWTARSQLVAMRSRPDGAHARGTPEMRELLLQVLDDEVLVDALVAGPQQPSEAPAPDAEPPQEEEQTGLSDLERLLGKKLGTGERPQPSSAIQGLFERALADTPRISKGAVQTFDELVQRLEAKFAAQIDLILHHDDFKALEATWRGLDYVVSNVDTDEDVKIRVLNVSKADLRALFEAGGVLGENPLLSRLRGEPYGVLIGDYAFDHGEGDVALLGALGQVAGAVGAPFIAGASPSLMKLGSWRELASTARQLAVFADEEYAAWRAFSQTPAAQHVALTMPRFLARMPYGRKTNPAEGVEFEEDAPVDDSRKFVWCNAAYAMAVVIGRAASIDGWELEVAPGGEDCQIGGLPCYPFTNRDGDSEMMCPTEVRMPVEFAVLLSRAGLAPLLHLKNTDRAVFVSVPSVGRHG